MYERLPPYSVDSSPPSEEGVDGQHDLLRQVKALNLPVSTVLDIGFGNGFASRFFAEECGYRVTSTGFHVDRRVDRASLPPSIDVLSDIDVCDMRTFPDNTYDAVWCSHVLEHVLNIGQALAEIRRVLRPTGHLFVCVPPHKHNVVGGHYLTGWNVGQLAYLLAVAGFDVTEGQFIRHGYNIAAIVRNGVDVNPATIWNDRGDIESLTQQGKFPPGLRTEQGFNGNTPNWNWSWRIAPEWVPPPRAPSPIEAQTKRILQQSEHMKTELSGLRTAQAPLARRLDQMQTEFHDSSERAGAQLSALAGSVASLRSAAEAQGRAQSGALRGVQRDLDHLVSLTSPLLAVRKAQNLVVRSARFCRNLARKVRKGRPENRGREGS